MQQPDPTIIRIEDVLPGVDPHAAADARDIAAGRVATQVPRRHAHAVATVGEVADWVCAVVHRAAAESRTHNVAVQSGPSLLLLGLTGCGKTFQAYGAMRALAASGVRCRWELITAADIYARLRPRHGVDAETEFRAMASSPLLAIDDLGAAKGSEWTEEVNYRLINHRYERELPTLITSNLAPRQLAEGLGDRVASRLREMTTRVVLEGGDRRGREAA